VRAAKDLTDIRGTLNTEARYLTLPIAFSRDGTRLLQLHDAVQTLDVFDTSTFRPFRKIPLPQFNRPSLMTFGADDALLIFADDRSHLLIKRLKAPATATPPAPAHSLLNVSTRLRAGIGDNALIAGFIISGDVPKKVVVRAIGPSLPLAGKLADPQLALYDGAGVQIASNGNWNSNRAEVFATGVAPDDEKEPALVETLAPGSYTAVVRGVADTAGLASVEIYDLAAQQSKLANLSTRGRVGVGDNVMIGGFILGGDQPTRIILRALGPSLRRAGVPSALLDTILELHDGNGATVAQNDDWRSDQAQEITATGVPPIDNRESAIVRTLAPGAYTAIVRGKNNTQGVGLVEVYNLDLN
jgi:DNA-binding beta-propeller fold protein YncE